VEKLFAIFKNVSHNTAMDTRQADRVIYRKKERITARVVGDSEVVIPFLPPGEKKHKALVFPNASARAIWRLIDGKNTLDDIREKICGEYEAEADTVKSDVRNFIHHLKRSGLIELCGRGKGK